MNGIVEGEVGIDMRGGIDVDGQLNLSFYYYHCYFFFPLEEEVRGYSLPA